MCTTSTVSMVLGRGKLDNCLLLVLGPLCCLGQLLDRWLINSKVFVLFFLFASLYQLMY